MNARIRRDDDSGHDDEYNQHANGEICQIHYFRETILPKLEESWSQVTRVQRQMENVTEHTKHLSQLPHIQSTLSNMNNNLVAAATGQKHIPYMTHIIAMGCMAIIVLALVAERWHAGVEVGTDGVRFRTQPHINEQH